MAMPLASAGNSGRASVQPSGSRRIAIRSNSALRSGLALAQAANGILPLRVGVLAALGDLAGMVQRLVLDREVDFGVEVQDLLGRLDLGHAERGAVGRAGALLVRGGPADDGPQRDERRRLGVLLGRLERLVQGVHVLVIAASRPDPVHLLHVPAVGLVARAHVLGLGDVGVVLDGDLVVVVEDDQVAQLLVAGQRGDLVADALLDVPVGHEAVHVVVERAGARRGVRVEQAALAAGAHGHAHGVADALAERAGGDLHAGGEPVLRVAGGDAAPGPQRLEVIHGQP